MRLRDSVLRIAEQRQNLFTGFSQVDFGAALGNLKLGGDPAGLELRATGGAIEGTTAGSVEEKATRGLWSER